MLGFCLVVLTFATLCGAQSPRTLLINLPGDSSAPVVAAFAQIAAEIVNADPRYSAFMDLRVLPVATAAAPMSTFSLFLDAFRGANISGIVGPSDSGVAVIVAAWASTVGVPVVSYSATAPSLGILSDYPTFLRVVADDGATLQAAIALLLRADVSRAAFIAQDDSFGLEGLSTFSTAAAAAGVDVLFARTIPHGNCSSAADALDLAQASGARYFLLWAFPACTDVVLLAAAARGLVGPAYVWILASETTVAGGGNVTAAGTFDGTLVVEPATAAQAPGADLALQQRVLAAFAAGYPALSTKAPPVYAFYAADAVFTYAAAFSALPASWAGGVRQRLAFDRVMSVGTLAEVVVAVRCCGAGRGGGSESTPFPPPPPLSLLSAALDQHPRRDWPGLFHARDWQPGQHGHRSRVAAERRYWPRPSAGGCLGSVLRARQLGVPGGAGRVGAAGLHAPVARRYRNATP